MPSMTGIVAFDSNSNSHTFVPVSNSREGNKTSAHWRENIEGVGIASQAQVIISSSRLNSGVNKVEVEVVLPIQEVVTGSNSAGYTAAPKVAHTPRGKVTFFFDERATAIERGDIRMFLSNILRGSTVDNATGTGSKPGPSAIDDGIMPV
uniref:Capsid protein n=1 Tax=Wenling levi-like virus 4 TaxID=1923500 RepID=A0A1L3KIN2_9VIRU|nr:hypothetical protein [Wenling levi-like virus 4]